MCFSALWRRLKRKRIWKRSPEGLRAKAGVGAYRLAASWRVGEERRVLRDKFRIFAIRIPSRGRIGLKCNIQWWRFLSMVNVMIS